MLTAHHLINTQYFRTSKTSLEDLFLFASRSPSELPELDVEVGAGMRPVQPVDALLFHLFLTVFLFPHLTELSYVTPNM